MTGTSHQRLVGFICSVADLQPFDNDSPLDFRDLLTDPAAVAIERRQALITAALTGETDVTTARGVAWPREAA